MVFDSLGARCRAAGARDVVEASSGGQVRAGIGLGPPDAAERGRPVAGQHGRGLSSTNPAETALDVTPSDDLADGQVVVQERPEHVMSSPAQALAADEDLGVCLSGHIPRPAAKCPSFSSSRLRPLAAATTMTAEGRSG